MSKISLFRITTLALLIAGLSMGAKAQAPSVVSVNRLGDAAGYEDGQRDFIVRFSEMVNGVGAADFATTGSVCVTTPSTIGNEAISLSGADSRLVIPSFANFPSTTVTVELWVRTTDTNGAIFFYSAGAANLDAFRLGNPTSLTLKVNTTHELTSTASINDGNWHHVAATWNGSNGAARILVDGVIVASSNIAIGESIPDNGTFVLGQDLNASGVFTQNFEGDIDELRIWSAVRTINEINGNNSRRLDGTMADLSLYMMMDEFVDEAVADALVDDVRDFGPNGNHADASATATIQTDATQLDGSTRRVRVDYLNPNPGITLGLDVLDDGTIEDEDGNGLTGPFSGGEVFTITPGSIAPFTFQVPTFQFPTIASAILESCSGDTIEIAPGTYNEHSLDLTGKSLVIRGTGEPGDTVIDAQDNGRIFFIEGEAGTNVTLENLTVLNGRAPNSNDDLRAGGGIFIRDADVLIRRCNLELNRAGNGIGSIGGQGGALAVGGNATVNVVECLFEQNRAGNGDNGLRGGPGGALFVNDGAELIVRRSRFFENAAGDGGSGGDGGDGGVAFSNSTGTELTFINCIMAENRAGHSGSLAAVPGQGGAIQVGGSSSCTVHFSTIIANNNGEPLGNGVPDNTMPGSATGTSASATLSLNNSIVRGPGPDAVSDVDDHTIIHCNVKGLGSNGVNSIDAGPGLVSLGTRDFRLNPSSVCVNAGNTSSITDIDIEGRVRIYGFNADIGAHEYYELPGTGEDFTLDVIDLGDETGINPGELLRFSMATPGQTFVGSPLTLAAQLQFSQVPVTESFPGAFLSFASPFAITVVVGAESPFGPAVLGPLPTDYFLSVPPVASGLAVVWQAFALDGAKAANGIFASTDAAYTYVR
jgi:Concanavalin A-like lectin/glucanases superfamily